MNREEKKSLRGILFRHLDGIAVAPTVSALYKGGISSYILQNPNFSFQNLSSEFEINEGYLNVALRLLASQGWLQRKIIKDGEKIDFNLTGKGRIALFNANYYTLFCDFIPTLINIDQYLFSSEAKSNEDKFSNLIVDLKNLNNKYNESGTTEWEMVRHLEGLLVGPILVALGMSEFFTEIIENDFDIDDEIIHQFPQVESVINLFTMLDWIDKKHFTNVGKFFLKRAVAYGVTVSYLPTFMQTSELLFGNPNKLWIRTKEGLETHVDRRMNVWGSGGAHTLYFKKIDEIITNLFNLPLDKQPVGIADMGCGDGTLLRHLYNVVNNQTLRGKNLDNYPLIIIGADFNKAARLASTLTLKKAGIEHSILNGDISDPSSYAKILKEEYGLDLHQMLNVRSFLDHNRIYSSPKRSFKNRVCHSTGAFAFRGRLIPNNELKQNLVEHFSAWRDYVSTFGLLLLELHTIDPHLTSTNLGDTVATAYDGTHGYSDQYIFEVETVLSAAEEAGLSADPKYQACFPNEKLATISINLFRATK